jgi:hypothetical protein
VRRRHHLRLLRRLRMRVATATRPHTVIGIGAGVQTRERPRRRVMRHSYSRQASPHSRPLPAGDSMIPTYLIAGQMSAPALRRPILSQAVMLCVMVYGGEVTYMTDPSPRSPRATMTIKRW